MDRKTDFEKELLIKLSELVEATHELSEQVNLLPDRLAQAQALQLSDLINNQQEVKENE